MAFIHPFSDECTSSQLEVFKIPTTVTAVENERYFNFKPAAALTSSNWIEFRVPSTEEFVDLSKLYLELEISVTLSDGSALPTAAAAAGSSNLFENIIPTNYFMSSLFQQLDLYLSNTLVTSATNLYHYRSYLDTLFYQSKHSKDTYLYSSLWDDDESRRKERIKRVYSGKTFKLVGPLHFDLAQQERLLLNFVDMVFRLNLTDPSFCFTIGNATTDRPRFNIVDASLHVLKKKLFPDCEAGILTALQKTTAKYFFTHTQLRHRIIDSGSQSFYFDNIFPSTLPRRFIFGILPAKAFNGDWKSDPYAFKDNALVEIKAYVDSLQTPTPGIKLDMEEEDYARAYYLFFDSMYSLHPATQLSITPADFKKYCTFFCWTLSTENDLENTDTIGLIRRGHLRIDFRFKKATTEHLAAIIYSHFPQVMQIDADRNVLLESV